VAGVVYRPLTAPTATWAAGAAAEDYREHFLNHHVEEGGGSNQGSSSGDQGYQGLLTSNGAVSPYLIELMREMRWERVPAGGAGNKMLMLLEGKGSAYIQDR
jgi:hypothetical protein